MSRVISADNAMRDYLRLSEAAATPAGLDPVAMRGRQYLLRCPECGASNWRKHDDGIFRCQALRTKFVKRRKKRARYTKLCATHRPWRSAVVLKGHIQGGSRGGSGNAGVERVAQLGMIFRVLSEQQRRAFSTYVSKGSYAKALEHCHAEWPWYDWTESQLRRLVKEARQRVEAKLERRAPFDLEDRVA